MRTEGVVLIARKNGEYWFIDSVFRYNADSYGCTGTTVYPVSKEEAEDALLVDNLEDRYSDVWGKMADNRIEADCAYCADGSREEGCEVCGYQSLRDFCDDIARRYGYDAVFDNPGDAYKEVLRDLLVSDDDPDCVETVHCSSGGRILAAPVDYADFDKVYNPVALNACLAYERGAVSYDYAVRAIFNRREGTTAVLARWESRGRAHYVELRKSSGCYSYTGNGCGDGLGAVESDQAAVAIMQARVDSVHFLPVNAKLPMKRVL